MLDFRECLRTGIYISTSAAILKERLPCSLPGLSSYRESTTFAALTSSVPIELSVLAAPGTCTGSSTVFPYDIVVSVTFVTSKLHAVYLVGNSSPDNLHAIFF